MTDPKATAMTPGRPEGEAAGDPAAVLAEITRIEELSRRLHGYAEGAPHMLLWGAIWVVANLSDQFLPALGGLAWPVLVLAGTLGSTVLGARRSGRAKAAAAARWLASAVAVAAGLSLIMTILPPDDPAQVNAAISLAVATAYALLGIWRGPVFLLLGIVIAAAVMAGWFLAREVFPLVMALVGGGALILGGWLLMREDRA
ncbi:MAG: hypothetical protein KatS3mg119_1435 [Rhodothalassiaceae bacterium]|nr:MAG: hypothetical protein KatS3mg119_1435 [Rhodothalassiaceae bacterium]